MLKTKRHILLGAVALGFGLVTPVRGIMANDCTGDLPGLPCTLDEDTTAPLTIDSGVTLTVGASVLIGHEIDADDLAGDGTITTLGGGNNIVQSADIGSNLTIDEFIIADDNVWTTSAAINTDATGSDIDLGMADGGETLNFISGGSYVGEIDGHNGDIVNFGSDGNGGAYVTNGQIETVSLVVTSGALTANNTLGGGIALGGVSIADGASLIQNANISTDGALDLDGTLTIGAGNTFAADTYVADADSGTIVIELNRAAGATNTGQLSVAAGGPLDLSNDVVQINLQAGSQKLISETINDVFIGNGGAAIAPGQFVENSLLYDFSLVPNGGNNFNLIITVRPASEIASGRNNQTVAAALLDTLSTVSSTDINQIQTLLGTDSTSAAFNERLESLQPTVDGGYVAASLAAKQQMEAMAFSRTNMLHKGAGKVLKAAKTFISGSKNLVTGQKIVRDKQDFKEEKGTIWAQVYGHSATQSDKDGIDGFDSTGAGVVFGADTGDMRKDMIIGASILAGTSDVESKNANATQTDIANYGGSIYGGVKVAAKTLVSGSLSYMHNVNKVLRRGIGGVAGSRADGEFPAQHVAWASRVSRRYETDGGVVITPSASFDYDYINAHRYRERGNTQMAMDIDYDAVSMMAVGVGVDAEYEHVTQNGTRVIPSAYARYKYDVLNDGIHAKSTYRAAPTTEILTQGFEPQKNIVNAGAALEAYLTDSWKLAFGYDFQYKDSYAAHAGYANVKYEF